MRKTSFLFGVLNVKMCKTNMAIFGDLFNILGNSFGRFFRMMVEKCEACFINYITYKTRDVTDS